jgi:hypothetical protein
MEGLAIHEQNICQCYTILIGAIYFLSIFFLHSLNMIMMHNTLKHCQDVARLDCFSGCVKQ